MPNNQHTQGKVRAIKTHKGNAIFREYDGAIIAREPDDDLQSIENTDPIFARIAALWNAAEGMTTEEATATLAAMKAGEEGKT